MYYNNKPRYYKRNDERDEAMKDATPDWVLNSELEQFIKSEALDLVNLRSKATGIKHQLDHWAPIKGFKKSNNGREICGLNYSENFQVIPGL